MNASGPGGMSLNGPGAAMNMSGPGSGVMSLNGPGNTPRGNAPLTTADIPQTTADGRQIKHEGPPCSSCGEMIIGPCINAISKNFHPQCFVCEYCSQPFPGGKFMVHEDEMYCEKDYHELFSKICLVCNTVIHGKCTSAKGFHFHPEHFCCCTCGSRLNNKAFKCVEEKKELYCLECAEKFVVIIDPDSHICAKCKRPIVGEYLELNGQKFCSSHYRCSECACELYGGNCRIYEDNFYCQTHYDILMRKGCMGCGKPIMGRSITALGGIWHPEHFACEICNCSLADSPNYYEKEGKPYCEQHYIQYFATACATCQRPIMKDGKKFLEKSYHPECFICSKCDKVLREKNFTEWESEPICGKCYDSLPSKLRKRVEKRKRMEAKAKKMRERDERKRAKQEAKLAAREARNE
eukprot:TRINITY_DN1652_c0_g1_i2.p1 TRINITY_DN1652_c0_g1~~TRINITY_DN1652_c0_g1_i2.p1  ORF type:complete len:409 (-),score=77.97 TRINITY_DN1652_c0_g1_i2:63-1289(-)